MQSPNVLYRERCGAKSTSVRLSTEKQTCPYDAQASIFKCCMSAVYPVSREHVTALNMSVRLCAGQEGDADSGAGLPHPRSARHFRSSQCRCDPFPAATPYLAELLSKFLFLYIPWHPSRYSVIFHFLLLKNQCCWSPVCYWCRVGGRGEFSKARHNLLQPSKEVITSTGFSLCHTGLQTPSPSVHQGSLCCCAAQHHALLVKASFLQWV